MDDLISLHDTRSMLDMHAQLFPPTTHLRDTYFSRVTQHPTKSMDIDIKKGGRSVAISVNPKREGKTVDRHGYKTRNYEAPYFKEKKILTGQDLLVRQPGQTIYAAQDGLEATIAAMLAEDLMELEMRFTRAEELQAAQLLQTGKCEVYQEVNGAIEVVQEIDFGMDTENQIEVDINWADPLSNPIEDLVAMMRLVSRKSGKTATHITMGEEAAKLYRAHQRVKHYYDTLHVNIGSIGLVEDPDGSMLIGPFQGAVIREYPAWYVHPVTGEESPFIDPYKVIVTSKAADFRRHYGAIVDVKEKVAAAVARFPKVYGEDDPAALFLMLQSAFLLAPHDIDALVVGTVGEA